MRTALCTIFLSSPLTDCLPLAAPRCQICTIYHRGLNSSGQLGQGDDLDRGDSAETLGANLPAIALGTGDVPTAIDCGSLYTCALLDDGSAKW